MTTINATMFYLPERKSLYFEQGSFSCGNNGRLQMDR